MAVRKQPSKQGAWKHKSDIASDNKWEKPRGSELHRNRTVKLFDDRWRCSSGAACADHAAGGKAA
jgi:hypothetical protein